ncbi:hypothetical protein AB3S75_038157 [Citrus x aurantiifolia]
MVISFLYSNRSHETQHPFHLLFSALIERLAHKWEIMTLNSETLILETSNSRWLCGRISTNHFCIRPTNNPSVFESKIRPPDSRPMLPVEKLYIYRIIAGQRIDMLGFVWNMDEDFASRLS